MLKGPRITRLFASTSLEGPWGTQDLHEPVNGMVSPTLGSHRVSYRLRRHVYAFSSVKQRWAILELPEGVDTRNRGGFSYEGGGHVYTFDHIAGKWKDLDINAIFDAPDDKEPDDAELPQPQSRRPT